MKRAVSLFHGGERSESVAFCLISAYRRELGPSENQARSRRLEQDIQYSELSYVKSTARVSESADADNPSGANADIYLVIDNKYCKEYFKKLALHWCEEYRPDRTLLAIPDFIADRVNKKGAATAWHLEGRWSYLDSNGNTVGGIRSDFTESDIEDFVSSVCGSTAQARTTEVVETKGIEIYRWMGRMLGCAHFKELYPQLVSDSPLQR